MKPLFYGWLLLLASIAGIQEARAQDWDAWHPLGNNVSVSFAQVPGTTTWTWRFQNNGTATISYMDFYVTDSTGQNTDVFPGTLAPGAILGGWAAFTAVSPPTILIKTIQWANTTGDTSPTTSAATAQQLQQQQAAQQAYQQLQQQQQAQAAQQQQQALIEQQRAAQQARQQQIVNNAYASVNANNNAAQAVNNFAGTVANVFAQQQLEKEQRAEQKARDQATYAEGSQNFADEAKAWRAEPDYQEFLTDYASTHNGAGFSADPDAMTDASTDGSANYQIHQDLLHEKMDYGSWKEQPVNIVASQTFARTLSLNDVVSEINAILTVHIVYPDDPSYEDKCQVNEIDSTGICITQTGHSPNAGDVTSLFRAT